MTSREALFIAVLGTSIFMGAGGLCAQTTAPAGMAENVDAAVILADARQPQIRREEAARRIIAWRNVTSRQLIRGALEDSSDPQKQLAAARAVATGYDASADYLVPLRLMMGTDRSLTEAAAAALASYKDNPESLRLLINFASSRQQRESDRLIAIRAIGSCNFKSAAEFLVSLLVREDDSQRIRSGASDALIEMTGQYELGQDATKWQRWWEEASRKSEAQWHQELQAYQAARYTQTKLRYEQLNGELQTILTRVYEGTSPAQQASLLLTYLRSSNPEIRRVGATIIHSDAMAARPIPAEAREQLRSMISDSSRDVRMAVSIAMLATNDPASLDALLAQMQRETDPVVRAALAAPVASIGDLKAVPALRRLIQDSSPVTAAAGAAALRELAPIVREKDPALAKQIAGDLRAILIDPRGGPGTLALREAAAEALIPLRDPELIPVFYGLLRERSSTRMRWAALRALGEIRDPKSADTIARYLEDRESGVRLEAVRAIGRTSPAEYAELIYRRTNPVEETDASVREEAWQVLRTTFGGIPLEQLPTWVQRFANDANRRVVVLRAMIDREDAKANPQQLAASRQQLGNCLMELNQPAEAAQQYKAALDFYHTQGNQDMVVEQLVERHLVALIRSRSFAEAGAFSNELLSERASYQQTVGVTMRNEARYLLEQQRPTDALLLIETARKLSPSLASRYMSELIAMEREARPAMPTTNSAH